MLKQLLLSGLAVMFICSNFSTMADETNKIFDPLLWKSRVLVLTGDQRDNLYQSQISMLDEHINGLNDRDMVVLSINKEQVEFLDDLSVYPQDFSSTDPVELANDDRQYLEERLNTPLSEFSVVLIGKDGGTKNVWDVEKDLPIAPQKIFNIIDSMPMRQQEMRDKN